MVPSLLCSTAASMAGPAGHLCAILITGEGHRVRASIRHRL
ncbi:hypothetical protein [Azospirillum argentinense]|uniref:Uncharacterized protein n=1 Tax=Azospirillum argentinense TaxID=2970906 RepID=A0A5B0KKS6_9PROT|nr:hypothetical protein FH063_002880 [Azospirillum argentinense]